MNKHLLNLIAIIILGFSSGCSKENDLKSSVFIPDPQYQGLPIYSEWGYNTFGAYYDRTTFISDPYTVPIKILVQDSTMIFNFSGRLQDYYHNDIAILSFSLNEISLPSYTSLIELNGKTFDLKEIPVEFTTNDSVLSLQILSGKLEFKRAQLLRVDFLEEEVILSGYFDFKAIVDGEPITISDGRFDVGVGDHNFYVIE